MHARKVSYTTEIAKNWNIRWLLQLYMQLQSPISCKWQTIPCAVGSDLRPANISTICNVSFVSLKQGSFILSLTEQTIYNNDAS